MSRKINVNLDSYNVTGTSEAMVVIDGKERYCCVNFAYSTETDIYEDTTKNNLIYTYICKDNLEIGERLEAIKNGAQVTVLE